MSIKLSIITSLYKSQDHLWDFYGNIKTACEAVSQDSHEIILVNDGCPNDSLTVALEIASHDDRVKVIDLSRNFGHHQALLCGLENSRGDRIFLIDCDLEEDPAILEVFWAIMDETNADLVNGKQVKRKGNIFEQLSGRLFYALMKILGGKSIESDLMVAKLMNKKFRGSLLRYKEKAYFLSGILSLTGYNQKFVPCVKTSKGSTTYTFIKRFRQALDALVSFSNRPLYIVAGMGALVCVASVLTLLYIVLTYFLWGYKGGWASIVAIITLVGGMSILSSGMIGIYIAKIFDEVKDRPRYTINRVYGCNENI